MTEPYLFSNIDYPATPPLKDPTVMKLPSSSDLRKMKVFTFKKNDLIFSIAESTPAPGGGVHPHVHHCVHEWFYAPEGGITMLYSPTPTLDVNDPPSFEKGTQQEMYLIRLQPGQGLFAPANHLHCFFNQDKVERPLRTLFIADPTIPSPFEDGGVRGMFETMSEVIEGTARFSHISKDNKENMHLADLKYNTNHSLYFFQYINQLEHKTPDWLKHNGNPELLHLLLDTVRAYNAGSKDILCY